MGFAPLTRSYDSPQLRGIMSTLASESDTTAAVPETAPAMAYWPRIKPVLLAVAFPLLLLAIWHFATVNRPASLIPPPYDVWQELEDLAVGGINDDAYSGTLLTHLLRLDQPRLWRLRAGARGRAAARPADRPRAAGAATDRSDHPDPAARAGHRLAAAGDDHLRARSALGVLPGVSRRVLSDPGQHHLRRARGRAAAVRGGDACSAAPARRSSSAWCCRPPCPRSSPACGWASASPGS